MNVHIFEDSDEANERAAQLLAQWLVNPGITRLMVASGNTPLPLYRLVGAKNLPLPRLSVFALDEYVGVPLDEPENCANLMRNLVARPWGIPEERFYTVSSQEEKAQESIREHEKKIEEAGGLDAIVLGLGQNGHLGFNEPGSAEESPGRMLELEPISVEANRKWFKGKYAPNKGVTVGLKTILAARRVMILAYGEHKRKAVQAMVEGPVGTECPASFLQKHPEVHLYVDRAAAGGLKN